MDGSDVAFVNTHEVQLFPQGQSAGDILFGLRQLKPQKESLDIDAKMAGIQP